MIVEPLLGTRGEVVVSATDPGDARSCEAAVVAEARRLEQIFSRFDTSSALHRYRRDHRTDVPELLAVIALANEWQARTEGAFHPGAQPLVDLWDDAERAGAPPSAEQLVRAVEQMTNEPGSIDLNAIAKGWIADTALSVAVRARPSVTEAWLNLGGDLVHRGEGSVTVGIENPNRPYDNVPPLATVELSNESMATSGGARRFWTIDGVRYPKVIDPRSGVPSDRMASATVVAPDGATADALATVAVFLDADETLDIAAKVGAACFLMDRDGSQISSSARFRPSPSR